VRQHYPDVRVGDIEAYPFASVPDLIAFIDGVEKRLKELNVRGMDFFQIDVDWVHFIMDHPEGWTEVKQLENACRARKIPFSLLYWAADYGHLKRSNLADDSTWYPRRHAPGAGLSPSGWQTGHHERRELGRRAVPRRFPKAARLPSPVRCVTLRASSWVRRRPPGLRHSGRLESQLFADRDCAIESVLEAPGGLPLRRRVRFQAPFDRLSSLLGGRFLAFQLRRQLLGSTG